MTFLCIKQYPLTPQNLFLLCILRLGFCLLFRFIRPENIPVQYGGLSRASDLENGPPKPASEFTVKGGEKVNIQIEGIEVTFFLFSFISFTLMKIIMVPSLLF